MEKQIQPADQVKSECPCCGGFSGIDVVSMLEFVGSHMVMEWIEAPELVMQS